MAEPTKAEENLRFYASSVSASADTFPIGDGLCRHFRNRLIISICHEVTHFRDQREPTSLGKAQLHVHFTVRSTTSLRRCRFFLGNQTEQQRHNPRAPAIIRKAANPSPVRNPPQQSNGEIPRDRRHQHSHQIHGQEPYVESQCNGLIQCRNRRPQHRRDQQQERELHREALGKAPHQPHGNGHAGTGNARQNRENLCETYELIHPVG